MKVSVIITIYNMEKYLKKCLKSVINQTLKDIEIICVNDGSTDKSLKILEKYALKDSRIIIINQEHKGSAMAKNAGLKAAKGEYIGFVDADDWIDLNYYETLYNEAKKQNADLARTCYVYNYFCREEKEKVLYPILIRKYKNHELLNVNDHSVVVWNAIYRREYLQKNKIDYFDDIPGAHDFPFTARATYYSQKSIPVIGVHYHHRNNVKNQISRLTLERVGWICQVNAMRIEFINSVEYEKSDYLMAFKRCIWRYNDTFSRALDLPDFTPELQQKYVSEFIENFFKCKYPDELIKTYPEVCFEYILKKQPDKYIESCILGKSMLKKRTIFTRIRKFIHKILRFKPFA
ncbi:MAG: glycosyltransferase [Candidatus Gastranaerophilales bacterium]|nr:glycosyltransferase [Candidatus Gastranaerophilales bacterium]